MRNSWYVFQSEIECRGAGRAPNGADYRIVPTGWPGERGGYAVEIAFAGDRRSVVTDYHGNQFLALDDAREFAKFDGRHEIKPHAPISQRKRLD